ncbi:recombinase family protein [Bacillus thuringiensis]
MRNLIFGYARVSSKTQNLSRQLQELKEYGCDRIYEEKQSGEAAHEKRESVSR